MEEINQKELPGEFWHFLSGTKNKIIKKIIYTDKSNGYLLHLELPNNLKDLYQDYVSYLTQNSWEILYRERANLFSFIEAQNSNYKLRIEELFVSPNRTFVEIKIILLNKHV